MLKYCGDGSHVNAFAMPTMRMVRGIYQPASFEVSTDGWYISCLLWVANIGSWSCQKANSNEVETRILCGIVGGVFSCINDQNV